VVDRSTSSSGSFTEQSDSPAEQAAPSAGRVIPPRVAVPSAGRVQAV